MAKQPIMKTAFNKNTPLLVRSMEEEDILKVSRVHAEAFPRQTLSEEWITCNFNAFPRIRYYLAVFEREIVGYAQWIEKSGFRKDVVLELEQIAVCSTFQEQGVGTLLISQSLPLIARELEKRQASIKHILVSTRVDNKAQKFYAKTLNAQPEATLPNLFSADELLMISRNFSFNKQKTDLQK